MYRNRHGRGIRTPMFGTRLPHYRTKQGSFDDIVAAQIRRLLIAWPQMVQPLQFAVEDVPVSEPAAWEERRVMLSQCFSASHGIPARIVLYRMPLQQRARSRYELQWLIHDELIRRIADLYGKHPEELDPSWDRE